MVMLVIFSRSLVSCTPLVREVMLTNCSITVTVSICTSIAFRSVTANLQNRMISTVSLGLLVLLEAQIYHNLYRSGTNRRRF